MDDEIIRTDHVSERLYDLASHNFISGQTKALLRAAADKITRLRGELADSRTVVEGYRKAVGAEQRSTHVEFVKDTCINDLRGQLTSATVALEAAKNELHTTKKSLADAWSCRDIVKRELDTTKSAHAAALAGRDQAIANQASTIKDQLVVEEELKGRLAAVTKALGDVNRSQVSEAVWHSNRAASQLVTIENLKRELAHAKRDHVNATVGHLNTIDDLRGDVSRNMKAINARDGIIDSLKRTVTSLQQAVQQATQDDTNVVAARASDVKNQHTIIENQASTIRRMHNENASLIQLRINYQSEVAVLSTAKRELNVRIETQRDTIKNLNEVVIKGLNERINELNARINVYAESIGRLNQRINELNDANTNHISQWMTEIGDEEDE